eukprot:CAMPEP_0198424248 /NCGR_PEP_ID=MMETSP1452-20131203/3717_1 /TAXON_ID=1181717 /ORGANISM="Synchroma pusillum, Strain CCMP3072" /LENGTH=100 /DNA_ID=CAMNT_0044144579 /DNA_START=149 /DNA_END=447 /DNA_ORIENTATION=+
MAWGLVPSRLFLELLRSGPAEAAGPGRGLIRRPAVRQRRTPGVEAPVREALAREAVAAVLAARAAPAPHLDARPGPVLAVCVIARALTTRPAVRQRVALV